MQVTKLPILQQSKYNRYSFLENVNSFPVDIPRLIFVELGTYFNLEKKKPADQRNIYDYTLAYAINSETDSVCPIFQKWWRRWKT